MKIKLIILSLLPNLCFANDVESYNNSSSLIMFAVIFGLMYFMVIRPQNKRSKEQRKMLADLKVGDEVVTTSGMLGKVAALKKDIVILDLGNETKVMLQKQAISNFLQKGTISAIK